MVEDSLIPRDTMCLWIVMLYPSLRIFKCSSWQTDRAFRSMVIIYTVCVETCSAPVAVDNPDRASELELCSKYGPSVDSKILANLVDSFAELRHMVEEGKLTYPFSTRELVSVVTHLEKYPDDGVITVLDNVFAFDAYDTTLRM